ncbi:MAG: hypothetical protein ACR2PV_02165 [Gammaproteobacteria bacterium]
MNTNNLIWAEVALVFFLVLLIAAAYFRSWKSNDALLRGLALPAGTVRSILALWVVGSYVIFIFFGAEAINEVMKGKGGDVDDSMNIYQHGVSALTGIVGTVLGFYFGSRTATPKPPPAS